jgi:hypothetical protein
MKNENRIVELLAEMVKGQDRLTSEVSEMKQEISGMKSDVSGMKSDVSGLKQEMAKHNLQIAENSRAVLKLAEEIRLVAAHENEYRNWNLQSSNDH